MPRLVILADVDGTLARPGTDLPDAAGEFIAAVAASGGVVVPVSAKPVAELARLFGHYEDVFLLVGSGGGVVGRAQGGVLSEIVHEETLPVQGRSIVIDALLALRDRGTGTLLMFGSSDASFEVVESSRAGALAEEDLRTIVGRRPLRHIRGDESDEQLRTMRALGVSFLARAEPGEVWELISHLPVPPELRISIYAESRIPGWTWLEVFPARINKGSAARLAISALKLETGPTLEVIALGDATEDIAMFEVSNRSYCPSTASAEVRRAASVVIDAPGGQPFVTALSRLLREEAQNMSSRLDCRYGQTTGLLRADAD